MAKWMALLGILAVGAMALPAQATSVTFSGSLGSLSASAAFAADGLGGLTVTLTNTSTNDVLVQADVLTAVFFQLDGNPALTKVSALVASGSTAYFYAPATTNVGKEWAYLGGEGISATGLNIFGPGDRFDTTGNLTGPPSGSVGGVDWGITSAGDNLATPNHPTPPGPVTGSNPLIQNAVVFTFSGLPLGFDVNTDISDVVFQYGSDLCDPHFGGDPPPPPPPGAVPEPVTVLSGLMGLGGLGAYLRKRLQARAA
jgi:hypothetical protein